MNRSKTIPAKHIYTLLEHGLLQKYSYIIASMVNYASADETKLQYIADRKLEIRNEFSELQKRDDLMYANVRIVFKLRCEYFELVREQESIRKKLEKE